MSYEIICPACCNVTDARTRKESLKKEREIAAYARLKTQPLERQLAAARKELRRRNAQLSEAIATARVLAVRLQDNTASEDSPHYDRSRTWCDRQDDYQFATDCLRQINPQARAAERRLKAQI